MQRKEAFPPTTRSLAYLIRTVRRAVDQGTVKTIFRRSGKCFKIPELFFSDFCFCIVSYAVDTVAYIFTIVRHGQF